MSEIIGFASESLRLPPNAGVSLAMSESWQVCSRSGDTPS